MGNADLRRLQQQLAIHQAELELQNEDLLETEAELETSLERYTDFYDFAPVGYLTLGRDAAGSARSGTLRTLWINSLRGFRNGWRP